MAAILLEPPTVPADPATIPSEDQPDRECRDMNCPVCGSSSTYQTSGRWGCVQCGASWG